MSEPPEYFTVSELIGAAGISRSGFLRHQSANVGDITKARMEIPGLGLRYEARKCRKYLALVRPRKSQPANPNPHNQ